MKVLILIAIFLAAPFAFGAGHPPQGSPSPGPAVLKSVEVRGLEIKKLSRPKESQMVHWQKIIVGQEPLDGASLAGLPKNSMWKRLGFRNGDVIIKIDDRSFHSSQEMNDTLSRLLKDKKSSVDFHIIRQNQEMLLNYKIDW